MTGDIRRHQQESIIAELGGPAEFDAQDEVQHRVRFLVERLRETGTRGYVLGISGGVDSCTAGRLCQLAVERAREGGGQARFIAMRLPYGDQAAEAVTGFFTKYGDGGCDLTPLAGLTKRRVRAIARALGADEAIVNKVPTADLETARPGLPDETALGLSYDDIDDFLEGLEVGPQVHETIVATYHRTAHKRALPLAPSPSGPDRPARRRCRPGGAPPPGGDVAGIEPTVYQS